MNTGQRADPLIGRLVDGRYRVRARIARGGMATVYVATDLRLERRVALKVMHGHLSDDAVFQSRFIQEARSAARLSDPHVVNVFDQGQDEDMAYLVMEYLPGVTLRELIRDQRRIGVAQVVTIMDAILSGLAAAHRSGIIHRDVKPENVLLAEDGRIKIGDFGLARAATANTASGQMLLGTIAYLAPELVTRGTADARSDIYALGIVLYEMLTGEQPYKGEQPMQIAYQHATDSVPRPSAKNPDVPEPLDELVLWSTERDPEARPRDAGEMLARLREIEAQLGIAPQVARAIAVGGPTVAYDGLDSGEVTKALPAATAVLTPARGVPIDNAALLRARSRRRASRGGWLVALVLVLALAAGGTGWWFGAGPGSKIAIRDLTNFTFADASTALGADGLQAVESDVFSIDVASGLVVATEPGAGSRVDKKSTVTVLVSKGPQPHDIPALAGQPLATAQSAFAAATVTLGATAYQFTQNDPDTVLSVAVTPRGASSATDCSNGCTVHEGDSAVITASKGPVPDVAGMSITDATTALTKAGLVVSQSQNQQYSDTVASGTVVGIAAKSGGGNWQPNDTVTLVVSKGPQLFEVPNVVGSSISSAVSTLQSAGFKVSVDRANETLLFNLKSWDVYSVKSQNPAAGTEQTKGTTISLTSQ